VADGGAAVRRTVASPGQEALNAKRRCYVYFEACGEMAEWFKAAVLKTAQSTVGLPQNAPKLVVSGGKPADHKAVPACPEPSFPDTITAQFTAQ
jgi:hypothetical protein